MCINKTEGSPEGLKQEILKNQKEISDMGGKGWLSKITSVDDQGDQKTNFNF